MNVDDLQWQLSHHGGVPRELVAALLERGCTELVAEAARERGDWCCAEGVVRELCAAGEFGRAWEVVEPFAATGWQPAVRVGADVLLRWGRIGRALELACPAEPAGDGFDEARAWRDYAEVLIRAGGVEAAIEVLGRRLGNGWMFEALVELTEGQGCDGPVLELLDRLAEECRRDPERCGGRGPWAGLSARARVLARSGREEEAIRLLGEAVAARRYESRNDVELYAGLLARRGRIDELREHAGTDTFAALRPYVRGLEEAGRPGEAEAYLRGRIATSTYAGHYENALLELLVRQGRFEDAVAAVAHTFDNLHDGNRLQSVLLLLAEHGLHERALELTVGRSPEFHAENDEFWLRSNRWWLMGESGRSREAIAEIEALPPAEVHDRESTIAWLLARDGRLDEAIARLRPLLPGRGAARDLAGLLVRQGRDAEALAAVPGVAAQREEARNFWTRRG
ncbi:hypothetical protein [Kitasatospora sp. NPDC059827]|uniref:hypothetical protein n=1 Tax=Kitasatospora sp. NPDC059827 TaxID=3346964 RepID=UPI003668DA46